jgi:hypothetical protein
MHLSGRDLRVTHKLRKKKHRAIAVAFFIRRNKRDHPLSALPTIR